MENTMKITNNTEENRFETTIEGKTGILSYKDLGDSIVYDHTVVPKELGGRGIGSALAKYALDYARANDKKVIPQCSFIASYINKHEEYQDLV